MTIDDCFVTRWGAVNNSERIKVKLEESDGVVKRASQKATNIHA
ncbi:hypothetical protein VCR26J2_660043 [Vibrio coralliirubri]|nr:hypothetical protein VCR26J2_660043 [Vibrio coralliirubri]